MGSRSLIAGPFQKIADAASATQLVLPVRIRANAIVECDRHRVEDITAILVGPWTGLNCIDRGRQCRQLWAFMFHGSHLPFDIPSMKRNPMLGAATGS
jgi:hypothetical protein